jgi:8-oxo-dGTP pyrophosphatase MutT (NUDIX family)
MGSGRRGSGVIRRAGAAIIALAVASPLAAQRMVPDGARVRLRVDESRAQVETRFAPGLIIRGDVTGESADSLWVRPSHAAGAVGISKTGIRPVSSPRVSAAQSSARSRRSSSTTSSFATTSATRPGTPPWWAPRSAARRSRSLASSGPSSTGDECRSANDDASRATERSDVMLDALLANPDIARLARALERAPGRTVVDEPGRLWAAIALTFRLGGAEPELLMIKRAERAGDPWSGNVAVPGGRKDSGDADLAATAIRETKEEMGIDLARVGRILGTLDDLAPRTPLLPPISIRPFVVAAAGDLVITQSEEVAESFWVPLSAIRDQRAWETRSVLIRGTPSQEPTFAWKGHVVWGLTERVLRQLVGLFA